MPESADLYRKVPLSAGKCRNVPENAGFGVLSKSFGKGKSKENVDKGLVKPCIGLLHVGKMSTKGKVTPCKHWGFVGEMSEKSRRTVGEV